MNREPRSKVIETEEKNTVIFDEQSEAELWSIVFAFEEVSKKPLNRQQAECFIYCLLDIFFSRSDDVAELEDRITEVAEVMTAFAERIKGGAENEE